MAVALLVVLLWSSNLIVQKIAVGHLSVFALSFLRVAFVFPLLFFYPKPEKSLWKYFISGFFLIVIYLTLFGLGLKSDIGIGLSAFFLQAQVLFVILCCFLVLGEKPTWFQGVGFLISFVGVYLLTATSDPSDVPFFGVVFLLAACFSFGIGVAFSKKYKIGENMTDVTWLSIANVPSLFLVCLLFEGPLQTLHIVLHLSPMAIFCVLFGAILSTTWATYLWLSLLQKFPGSSVAPFMLLLPVFSNILSYGIMGESLTTLQIVSGSVIILGVMFAQGFHQYVPSLIYWIKSRMAS